MNADTRNFIAAVNADLRELFRRPPMIGTGAACAQQRPELVGNALYNGQSTGAPRAGWQQTEAYRRLRAIAEGR